MTRFPSIFGAALKKAGIGFAIAAALAATPAFAQSKLIAQSGSSAPTLSQIPLFVAQEAGFLKTENLEVELRFSPGAPQATLIAASGGADIGLVTLEPVIQGYDKGVRGKAIFSIYARQHFYYAVLDESPIRKIEDLAGKRLGVVNSGTAAIPFAKSMLRLIGAPSDDSLFLPVGLGDAALAALKTNRVDALAHWDAVYGAMERQGVKLRYFHHPALAEFGSGAIFVSDRTLAEKRAQVVGFARAYAKGIHFFLENPAAALAIYWKRNPAAKIGANDDEALRNGLKEAGFLIETFRLPAQANRQLGEYDLNLARAFFDVFLQQGLIPRAIDPAAIIANGFNAEINNFDVAEIRKIAREWK